MDDFENNRAPLLCCFKLSASFHSYWWIQTELQTQGSHKNLRKKFHDFSMTSPGQNPNFQTKNTNICFFTAHVSICRINYRQTQTHTHTQTHTWFDQGQLTIQLILLVIELVQEVKTTLVNLIKTGLSFFRKKPISSGTPGKKWKKPISSSFVRTKLEETGQNWKTMKEVRNAGKKIIILLNHSQKIIMIMVTNHAFG